MKSEMRKYIDDFKKFQLNEGFIQGPGGYLDNKSSNKAKFIYKINELSWLKDRFELHIDKLTDDDVEKYLDELSTSINNIHKIINEIRK